MYDVDEELFEETEDFYEGGFSEGDIYSEASRESQLDDDELSAEEDAFMRGYEEAA